MDLIWTLHDDIRDIPVVGALCTEPGLQGSVAMSIVQSEAEPVSPGMAMPFLRRSLESEREGLYTVCLKTGDAGM